MVIFRIERKVNILLNIVFYYAKIMTFMTIQHMDFVIRWASGKTSVRFRTIMTMRKLSVNMVVDRNFQKKLYKPCSFISCFVCFGGGYFRSWYFDDFGLVFG